jgi:DnaJ-class molecular chaperone
LGVSASASVDEIKSAYRALVRSHHPDVRSDLDEPEAHERFLEIKTAYEVLVDPDRRREHDRDPRGEILAQELAEQRLAQRLRRRRRLKRLYQ